MKLYKYHDEILDKTFYVLNKNSSLACIKIAAYIMREFPEDFQPVSLDKVKLCLGNPGYVIEERDL